MVRVTVWNEYRHEVLKDEIRAIYPQGMHAVIAKALRDAGYAVRTATLDDPDNGLPPSVLEETDVLFWWGHTAHGQVSEETVKRVYERVLDGMGLVVLHSGHASKIFTKLMGTRTGNLRWRESGDLERLWVMKPNHPIAAGLGEYFELAEEETYGEVFEIPEPDELVFLSWFSGGEVFRSGCCWQRGQGRVFYFRPGHESYPIYHDKNVQRVLVNAAGWTAPADVVAVTKGHCPVPVNAQTPTEPK